MAQALLIDELTTSRSARPYTLRRSRWREQIELNNISLKELEERNENQQRPSWLLTD